MIDLDDLDLSNGAILELRDGELVVIQDHDTPKHSVSATLVPAEGRVSLEEQLWDAWYRFLNL